MQQKEESYIKKLFKIKSNGIKVDKADTQKEEWELKVMLKDIEKLEIDENDLLYRRPMDDRQQLLLLKKLGPSCV